MSVRCDISSPQISLDIAQVKMPSRNLVYRG